MGGCIAADHCAVALTEGPRRLHRRLTSLRWGRPPRKALAPTIRDRIVARCEQDVSVDIQRLLACPSPGRRLSLSYKTVELLGQGSFGSVYRAEHVATGEDRAIKVIRKPAQERRLQRVLTEVQLLIQLDHPKIMKLHEYFEDARSIYLVTELCTAGDLGDLDASVDEPGEVKLLFRDIVGAIGYCHSQGVAHRDLKFENVLLCQPDSGSRRMAKVIDFGLSAIREAGETREEWMDDMVGTVYFMAPEVINGGSLQKYGVECDMWSIGVMLYVVLTDQHPFIRSTQGREAVARAVTRLQLRSAPLLEAGVEQDARDLIVRLLKRKPHQRLSARGALEHAWFRPPAIPPGSPSPGAGRGARRWRSITTTPDTSLPHMQSLLNRAHSFRDFSRFEKALMTLVAYKAKAKEVRDLKAAFAALDPSRAGWLTHEDFQTALGGRGIRLPPKELALLLEALDPDGDGKIGYTDWLAATLRPSALTSEKAMEEVFHFFDLHGEGTVSAADLREVLGEDVAEYFRCPSDPACTELDWGSFRKLMLAEGGKMEDMRQRTSRKIRWSRLYGAGSPG